jgi:DNA adenine methylase
MSMRTIFCRVGSKLRLRKKIIKLFPNNYEDMVYVEPFVGSGAVFFGKKPSKKEVLNDLDKTLMAHYKLINKASKEEIQKFKRLNTNLDALNTFVKQTGGSAADKLARYIIKTCNTFSQSGRGKIYRPYNPYTKLNKIDDYKDRLKGVSFTSGDYRVVMRRHDSNNTLFYLDPPYQNSERLYKNGSIDYEDMAIRNIFKDFKIKGITLKAQNPNNNNIGSKDRKEVFISNY